MIPHFDDRITNCWYKPGMALLALETALRDALTAAIGARPVTFVLAVSGGRDSMALLEAMSRSYPAERLIVAHYNHRTRGNESELDEALVKTECGRRGLRFVSERDPRTLASEGEWRQARRTFFSQVLAESGADYIVTAHHANDQLETVLMRLVRGTGLDGLQGIPRQSGSYLRPLLDVTRNEIDRYVADRQVKYRDDESNHSLDYLRNQIRHQAIPALLAGRSAADREATLKRIVATTDELAWVKNELDEGIADIYARLFVETDFWIRVGRPEFLALPRQKRLRLARRAIARVGTIVPSRTALNRLVKALEENRRGDELEGSIRVTQSCEQIFFHRTNAPRPRLELTKGRLRCPELGLSAEIPTDLARNCDARFPLPGDFQGTSKLKRIFLEMRIPKAERAILPLLVKPKNREAIWFFPQAHPAIKIETISFPFSFKAN
jgi:tRNA(Ile)-lysidine synthetase-like protein